MPPGFNFPGETDVWQLLRWDLAEHSRAAHFMSSVARLSPGVNLERAQAELHALTTRLAAEHPRTNDGWSARAAWLQHEVAGIFRPALFVMFAAVGLLLRGGVHEPSEPPPRPRHGTRALDGRPVGARRQPAPDWASVLGRECPPGRSGIGAGDCRRVGRRARARGARAHRHPETRGRGRRRDVLAFAVLLCVVVATASGLVPALAVSSGRPPARPAGERASDVARRGTGLRHALVAAEVALAVTLLAGAGLLVRSLSNLAAEQTGFEAGPAVTAQLGLPDTLPTAGRRWPRSTQA